jgi:hypothetical protein
MALQNNVTQITHTHDSTGLNGPKLLQVNTHQSADTDVSPVSLHHTLGTGHTQAAFGDHTHAQYVDLSNSQTITGKKTFPFNSTGNAIVIPDFSNSIHHHTSSLEGGVVFGAEARYNSGGVTINAGGSLKTDLLPAAFAIPAGYTVVGEVFLSLLNSASAGNFGYSFAAAVSYGPSSVTYTNGENITTSGNSGPLSSTERQVVWRGTTTGTTYDEATVIPIHFDVSTGDPLFATNGNAYQIKLYCRNFGQTPIVTQSSIILRAVPNGFLDPTTWRSAAAL